MAYFEPRFPCDSSPVGDAVNAVLCAAGFNLRWLLRTIAAKGIKLIIFLSALAGALSGFVTALPRGSADSSASDQPRIGVKLNSSTYET